METVIFVFILVTAAVEATIYITMNTPQGKESLRQASASIDDAVVTTSNSLKKLREDASTAIGGLTHLFSEKKNPSIKQIEDLLKEHDLFKNRKNGVRRKIHDDISKKGLSDESK